MSLRPLIAAACAILALTTAPAVAQVPGQQAAGALTVRANAVKPSPLTSAQLAALKAAQDYVGANRRALGLEPGDAPSLSAVVVTPRASFVLYSPQRHDGVPVQDSAIQLMLKDEGSGLAVVKAQGAWHEKLFPRAAKPAVKAPPTADNLPAPKLVFAPKGFPGNKTGPLFLTYRVAIKSGDFAPMRYEFLDAQTGQIVTWEALKPSLCNEAAMFADVACE